MIPIGGTESGVNNMTKREAIASIKKTLETAKDDFEVSRFEYQHCKKKVRYWRWELIKFMWKERKQPMDTATVAFSVPISALREAIEKLPAEYHDAFIAEIRKYFVFGSRGLNSKGDAE